MPSSLCDVQIARNMQNLVSQQLIDEEEYAHVTRSRKRPSGNRVLRENRKGNTMYVQ